VNVWKRYKILLATLLVLAAALVAHAAIVGPYTPDANTLHLWHLNETATPVVDSATAGINLSGLLSGATLGNASYTGFGNALNTLDGGQDATTAGTRDALLAASASAGNVLVTYADPTTGAFTYEAILWIGFDPFRNLGASTDGGNGRGTPLEIVSCESGTTTNRILQFRIVPAGMRPAVALPPAAVPLLTFENIRAGSTGQATIYAAIPTNGPDSILSNHWYHAAVTYNGSPDTTGNLKFYWTLLDPSRTSAAQISIISTNAMLSGLNRLSSASTPLLLGNEGRNRNGNFLGLIDEVRVSSVARPASGMMFTGDSPLPSSAAATTYLQCLVDFQRYAETVWHSATYVNSPPDSGYFGSGDSTSNNGIRADLGVAVAYAVLAQAYPDDPNRPAWIARIRQGLNYGANTHRSGTNICVDGLQWGHDWGSAMLTGHMGLACVLAQADLPATTVQACQRAIADEATYRAGIAPGSGYVGDTRAEDNAWDSNGLTIAAAWMASDTNAPLWLTDAKKYLANSYTVANTNGDPLASWITTVTLYPSFALENHGFYHPTYQMVAGMSLGDSLLMARLANPSVAAELQPFAEHNVLQVWTNLQHLVLDSGEFAYPSGLDWELHDYEQNSYVTWLATHFNDPLARWEDSQLAQLARYRQLVNGDGSFVGPSSGGFFREAVEAYRTAVAWLHWAHADYTNGPSATPGPTFEYLPDVKIIAQRGPSGFVSLSYGARIMAVIEPSAVSVPTNAYVTTPRQPGLIGLGALGNSTAARLVNLTTNAGGFQAELQLTNGANGTTEVYVSCNEQSIAIVEVPWPTVGVYGSSAGSFCVGIENDPLIGGSRLLEWAGGVTNVLNRSGIAFNITNNWVCVAGHYGLAAGPAGCFSYQAAASYNRAGAAQDTLQFMPQAPLSPRYAVWFPGQAASQTASNATLINWTVSAANCLLTFPGSTGTVSQISALLPPPPPPYPPYLLPIGSVTGSSWQAGFPPTNAVDGNLANFWVSYGTSSGQGPAPSHPEWVQVSFPRQVAVSEFQIYPRSDNGGYGPKDIQMLLDNILVYQGTMAPTSMLDLRLSPPVNATNAELLITSAYDRGGSTNPRNVQVDEMSFFERAMPGSYGDWALHTFTDAQLSDPTLGAATADPDHDGAPNLVEFAMGGSPLVADATNMALQPLNSPPDSFAFAFRERKNLGDVQRRFESSTDLVSWAEVTPSNLVTLSNMPDVYLRAAVFPARDAAAFFRLRFSVQSGP
jgi:hypothetical protein